MGTLSSEFPNVEAVEQALKDGKGSVEKINEILLSLANKADATNTRSSINNLQEQVNNIVIEASASGDVSYEVAQARVGVNGESHDVLKDRLDNEHNSVRNDVDSVLYTNDSIYNAIKDHNLWSLNTAVARATGIAYPYDAWITSEKLYFFPGDIISATNDIKVQLFFYNIDGSYINYVELTTSYYEFTDLTRCAISMKYKDDRELSGIDDILQNFHTNNYKLMSNMILSDLGLNDLTVTLRNPCIWNRGTLNISNGQPLDTDYLYNRARTRFPVYIQAGTLITTDKESDVGICYWLYRDGNYVENVGGSAKHLIIPESGYYRLTLRKTKRDQLLGFENLPEILNHIRVYKNASNYKYDKKFPSNYDIGKLTDAAGTESSATNRARSGFVWTPAGTVIINKDCTNITIQHYHYDEGLNYIGTIPTRHFTDVYYIPKDCYTRITIAYNDRRDITSPFDCESVEIYKSIDEYQVVENRPDEQIWCFAHRGYSCYAPENTMPAFKLAKICGIYSIELDVHFTQDGVAVLLHDNTINRTARNMDGSQIETTVDIRNITYNEALNYDYGIKFNPLYAGTKIPTFDEAISFAQKGNMFVQIDCGTRVTTNEQLDNIYNIVKKYGMLDNVIFEGVTRSNNEYLRGLDDNIKIMAETTNLTDSDIAYMVAHNFQFTATPQGEVADGQILKATAAGIRVHYVVDNSIDDIINYMNQGVTKFVSKNNVKNILNKLSLDTILDNQS